MYSEPGHGTTIRIYLPRVRQEEDLKTNIDAGPANGGTATILVVEDDEEVRATVVEMLSDLGYRVLRAKDAQSALAIVESGVPIDLLFTDVVMPGALRSTELARKTRKRLPAVAVLFTSGYTDNAIVHSGRLDEGIELLSKPYTHEALARSVRHVLADPHRRAASDVLAAGRKSAKATRPWRRCGVCRSCWWKTTISCAPAPRNCSRRSGSPSSRQTRTWKRCASCANGRSM